MKKITLFLWIIFLLSESCYDNRLDLGNKAVTPFIPFGIGDARQYFENNASDLSPLSFVEPAATKSTVRFVTDLHPKWDKAMLSGHSGVSLIEVPLISSTMACVREYTVRRDFLVGCRETVSVRRLVIAKRSDGEVDMFVITIVPNVSSTQSEMFRMMDDFRYLGGGTFSGRVYCSTLEGRFVKAFGYTDGKLNGTLPTRVWKSSDAVDSPEVYSRVIFSEKSGAGVGMFSSVEGGGADGGIDYGKCPHGYTKGFCPHGCDAEIGGVDIVVCPDCRRQDGCICLKCFYCSNKEKNCTCTRCVVCHNKLQECTCYQYPDPDNPQLPPGHGGGDGNSGGDNGGSKPGNNASKPDMLWDWIGTDEYYLKRIEDFKKRHPDKPVPDYYKNYGDFYLHEFKDKTYHKLSSQGKEWCMKTLEYLQREMSELLNNNNQDLELDDEVFIEKAFDTHVTAYSKAKIEYLSMTDKVFIFTTVYPDDLFRKEGIKQVVNIGKKQIQVYIDHPSFALEQARELSQNWNVYLDMLVVYLQEKGESDPRKHPSPKLRIRSTESVTMSAEDLMRLYFGESIEYFKATFGDQVSFPI